MAHPMACDACAYRLRSLLSSFGWEDRGAFPPKLVVVLSHPYPTDGGGLALPEGMSDLKGRDRAVCNLLYLARESAAAAAAASRSGCPGKDGGGCLGDGKSSASTLVLRLDGTEDDGSTDGSPDGVSRGYDIWIGFFGCVRAFGFVPVVQLRRR